VEDVEAAVAVVVASVEVVAVAVAVSVEAAVVVAAASVVVAVVVVASVVVVAAVNDCDDYFQYIFALNVEKKEMSKFSINGRVCPHVVCVLR
jgi:hypothetical protein